MLPKVISEFHSPAPQTRIKGRSYELGQAIAISLIIILVILRFFIAGFTELSEDEAYYWLWSTHLAAGYVDHPPMVAYWIRVGTEVFGQTSFGVRIVCLLSTLAGSIFLYLATCSLFRDRTTAFEVVFWGNVSLLYSAAAIIATPDTPLVCFWSVAIFALAKLIETGRGAWWYLVGFAFGAAMLSKFTALFMVPAVLMWMASNEFGRKWFFRFEPYAAALIASCLTAPMILWNAEHGWISFAKQLHHGFHDAPSNAFSSLATFIGGQAGLVTPVMFGFCLWGMAFAVMTGLKRKDPRWLLLATMSMPIFLFFLLHSMAEKIQPNWPGFLYPAAFIAAVSAYHAVSRRRPMRSWIDACYRIAPFVAFGFTIIAYMQLAFGMLPLSSKQDPTARMRGWADLARRVDGIALASDASFIVTTKYALTGTLAYYSARPGPVLQASERERYSFMPPPNDAAFIGKSALYVVRHGQAKLSLLDGHFGEKTLIATLKRESGWGAEDSFDVYQLRGYKGGLFR